MLSSSSSFSLFKQPPPRRPVQFYRPRARTIIVPAALCASGCLHMCVINEIRRCLYNCLLSRSRPAREKFRFSTAAHRQAAALPWQRYNTCVRPHLGIIITGQRSERERSETWQKRGLCGRRGASARCGYQERFVRARNRDSRLSALTVLGEKTVGLLAGEDSLLLRPACFFFFPECALFCCFGR